MAIPHPTKEYVEARSGVFVGVFSWPLERDEQETVDAFETPPGQMLHMHHTIDRKMAVYSLPELRPGKPGKVAMCANLQYDTSPKKVGAA